MSSAVAAPPLHPSGTAPARPTLFERLDAVLDAAHADAEAPCPLCPGAMRPKANGARCDRCGSVVT